MHLVYDLLDGYQALVIVDALPDRGRPGEVVVLEVGPEDLERLGGDFDAHGMDPVAVLAGLPALGGQLPPTYVVGAGRREPEDGIGLSPHAGRGGRAGRRARPGPARDPAVGAGLRGGGTDSDVSRDPRSGRRDGGRLRAASWPLVDVQGAARRINIGMLDRRPAGPVPATGC